MGQANLLFEAVAMQLCRLLSPELIYRSRYDALVVPVVFALLALGVVWRLSIDLPEYRALRDGAETASGVVTEKELRHSHAVRRRTEAVVTYAFRTGDGHLHRGTLVYPPDRVEHLQAGVNVTVYYQAGNPERSTTADGLHIRVWWELVPESLFLVLLLVATPACVVMSLRYWRGKCWLEEPGGARAAGSLR
jgi:hypothetical protein